MARHVVAAVNELPPGTRKFLTIDGRPIAIFNIKGEFFGLLNRCPHQGAALCEGPLIGLAQSSDPGEIEYTKLGEIIRCPWHGWEFDIRTGQSYCDPKRFRAPNSASVPALRIFSFVNTLNVQAWRRTVASSHMNYFTPWLSCRP